jgi:hypothetical protein
MLAIGNGGAARWGQRARRRKFLREQAFAEGEEAGAEGLGAGGEGALGRFVVGAAGGGFDREGREAEGADIVGARGMSTSRISLGQKQAAMAEYLDAKEHESPLISSTIVETHIAPSPSAASR